jgi:hypothetical protein
LFRSRTADADHYQVDADRRRPMGLPASSVLGKNDLAGRQDSRDAPESNRCEAEGKDKVMDRPRLEVDIYQIVDDAMLKSHRTDGTGFDWCWADWQRDWMNATTNRHAYRCLPLTIVNQTGWWIKNPVGFTANWNGGNTPGSIEFRFDQSGEVWTSWINSQFGEGIITWNTPFLFRTRPQGSRLLICGPANVFKVNAHPLTALIESDWMSMSFTMNWKVMIPDLPVRFELGEPLFQAIPLASNTCADLEGAAVTYQKLGDDPEMLRAYNEWHHARRKFHEQKAKGEVRPDGWQKDYFQGRDLTGQGSAPDHMTKVKPPKVRYLNQAPAPAKTTDDSMNHPQLRRPMQQPQQRPRAEPSGDVQVAIAASGPATATAVASLRVDDEWRRWIAENLMLGTKPDSIFVAMVGQGISREEAKHELELALRSPYVRGAQLLCNRLLKRDWLLATYRKLNRMHPQSGEVPRRDRPTRREFLEEYYTTNRPVIITGMMDDWPAMRKWNIDFFERTLGDRVIDVQAGRTAGDNYEIESQKFTRSMKFAEFLEMVRTAGVTNDFYLTANNNSKNRESLAELWDDVVQMPEYLNGDDAMDGFFWMGPAGTITPFHHDLTNNFMAQVIGRKRVKLAPSWDIPLMHNHYHVFSRVDGRVAPPSPHPQPGEPQVIECILNPGEILFLPIGWMHFVEGMDITVTVSFINFAFDNDFSSFYSTYHGV